MQDKQNFDAEKLAHSALTARKNSYAPYSNFAVGAALLAKNGKVYVGSNVENAAYSVTNCAERSALFSAVSDGEREFVAIAVAGANIKQADNLPQCTPCGVCRQALFEFVGADFPVILVQSEKEYSFVNLGDLLPMGFGPKEIEQ